jgi:two-component system sensor histidine kinase MtrB
VQTRFTSAINKLAVGGAGTDATTAGAGAFEPVLADGLGSAGAGRVPSVGKLDDVPRGLREMVEDGGSGTQMPPCPPPCTP